MESELNPSPSTDVGCGWPSANERRPIGSAYGNDSTTSVTRRSDESRGPIPTVGPGAMPDRPSIPWPSAAAAQVTGVPVRPTHVAPMVPLWTVAPPNEARIAPLPVP